MLGHSETEFEPKEEHTRWFKELAFTEHWQLTQDFLRSVKYWHSRRHIPGTKEGGFPSLVWLLTAIHVLLAHIQSGHKTRRSSSQNRDQVVKLLQEFFAYLTGPDERCHGWQYPSTLDPVSQGDLVHELPAATRLLYAAELHRARRLAEVECIDLFDLSESTSLSPQPGQASVVLRMGKLWLVQLQGVKLRGGWTAPFLHRCDHHSKVRGRILSVEESTGMLTPFPEFRSEMEFQPSEFVVNMGLEQSTDSSVMRLAQPQLQRWLDIRHLLNP